MANKRGLNKDSERFKGQFLCSSKRKRRQLLGIRIRPSPAAAATCEAPNSRRNATAAITTRTATPDAIRAGTVMGRTPELVYHCQAEAGVIGSTLTKARRDAEAVRDHRMHIAFFGIVRSREPVGAALQRQFARCGRPQTKNHICFNSIAATPSRSFGSMII